MKEFFILIFFLYFLYFLSGKTQQHYEEGNVKLTLIQQGALYLAELPLKCLDSEFPNKSWIEVNEGTFITRHKYMQPELAILNSLGHPVVKAFVELICQNEEREQGWVPKDGT